MNKQERTAFEAWCLENRYDLSMADGQYCQAVTRHFWQAWQARAALAAQQVPAVTEDMKSAVRWAPSSAYWSERLREFFGPDARDGIASLEKQLREAQALAVESNTYKAVQLAPDLHIGACIADGRLHATVMHKAPDGRITVVAMSEMDAAALQNRDSLQV